MRNCVLLVQPSSLSREILLRLERNQAERLGFWVFGFRVRVFGFEVLVFGFGVRVFGFRVRVFGFRDPGRQASE